jgi:hypothetical protein
VDADLDTKHPERLATSTGNGALVNTSDATQRLVSQLEFGDVQLRTAVMLAAGAEAVVYVHGRHGIRISDRAASKCGSIVGAAGEPDLAPKSDVRVVPGNWHKLEVDFRAPRFDASGQRIAPARFNEVRLDGELLHLGVELDAPSAGALGPEAAIAPLVLVATPRNVAFSDVRVKPVQSAHGDGWRSILEDDGLAGWGAEKGGVWNREDGVLTDVSGLGRLFTDRSDFTNVRIHAKAKISSGGLAWMIVRAVGARSGGGIAIALNADHPQPGRTGSISAGWPAESSGPNAAREYAPRRAGLIGADTWFDLDVDVHDDESGEAVIVEVSLNGVLVNAARVPSTEQLGGCIAFHNHHPGSVLEVSKLEILELSAPASDPAPPQPR